MFPERIISGIHEWDKLAFLSYMGKWVYYIQITCGLILGENITHLITKDQMFDYRARM